MTVTTERRAAGPAPPASRAALALLRQAGDGLVEAHRESEPLLRYPAAYLAALRAAAAVLAVRARPRPRRGAPRDVWNLLAEVAPELGEWAAFFAAGAAKRAAAEAGLSSAVTEREADDLVRDVTTFLGVVETSISRAVPPQSPARLRSMGSGSRRPAGRSGS
jgi:hypothetical protein